METEEIQIGESQTPRKLARIEKVSQVSPIDGADNIETVHILGWTIVTKKNQFKEGDLCVYAEIDSVFSPETPFVQFLRDVNRPENPIRLRSIRLRGQLSQGLVIPLEEVLSTIKEPVEVAEGADLTGLINGLTKYEPPISPQLAGIRRGNFPPEIPHTNEERIQNCFETVDETFPLPYYATEKLDGSSFTGAYFHNKEQKEVVCSRTVNLKETEGNAFWKVARKYNLHEKLATLGYDVAVQGELVGPNIQKNKLNLPEVDLYIFNIINLETGEFLDYANLMYVTQVVLGMKTVPVIEVFNDGLPFTSVGEILKYAERKSVINPQTEAEGLVFRPKEVNTRIDRFGRVSWKVINNRFLLKKGNED